MRTNNNNAMILASSIIIIIVFFGCNIKSSTGSPWLQKYIKFHNEESMKPISEHGYLVYDTASSGNGVADKLRPVVSMFRVAQSLNRVFIYTWSPFTDLAQYLEPNLINWNMTDSIKNLPRMYIYMKTPERQKLTYDHIHNELKIDPKVVVYVKAVDSPPSAEVIDIVDEYSDIMQALFKPSAAISRAVDQELLTLKVNPALPFVTIHLRMLYHNMFNGSIYMDNDSVFFPDQNHLVEIQDLLYCGEDFSSLFFTSRENPIIIISDSMKTKEFIIENKNNISSKFAVSNQKVVHITTAKENNEIISTFVDMYLMARSACVITANNHGRFAHEATKLGNGTYIVGQAGCNQFRDVYQIPKHNTVHRRFN